MPLLSKNGNAFLYDVFGFDRFYNLGQHRVSFLDITPPLLFPACFMLLVMSGILILDLVSPLLL